MSAPVEWSVLLPLAGAALSYLAPGRWAVVTAVAAATATTGAAVLVAIGVWSDGPASVALGGWQPPLGIALYADGLSALMLLMTAVIMLAIGIYAAGYFRHAQEGTSGWRESDAFLPLWLLLFAALNALFLSRDLFNLYVVLELVTLAGIALLVLAGGSAALTAGMRYLLAAFLASLLYLLGVALVYGEYHVLDLHLVRQTLDPSRLTWLALALMTAGLMIKAALFPFHAWLPPAHASAPAPVSAMLSALVVKGAVYMVLRLWTDVFAGDISMLAGQLVGFLGAAGIVWGSLQALREERLKLIVAHSTVAQVGFLFVVVPLATGGGMADAAWRNDAWSGGVYHILSHALAKAALFMCAGTILLCLASDRLDDIRGLATRMPLTAFAFGIGGIALIGLPPSGTFVAKWLLLGSAMGQQQWWWVVVIAAGTLLSGAYVFRVLRLAFTPVPGLDTRLRVPALMEVCALALALAALFLGLRGVEVLRLIEAGAPLGVAP